MYYLCGKDRRGFIAGCKTRGKSGLRRAPHPV